MSVDGLIASPAVAVVSIVYVWVRLKTRIVFFKKNTGRAEHFKE
jgi:hypothetical protein